MYIQPDTDFIDEIKKLSNGAAKNCMQCGECSAVCSLTPDDNPFPRKEMIWAAWGIKNKLIGNPDLWICYQCGDCSTYCPRGVRPADILAALRQLNYKYYARPKILGVLLGKPSWLPVALAVPVIIILAVLALAGTLHIPPGPVIYSKFFPHAWLDGLFMGLTFIVIICTLYGLKQFWNDMKSFLPPNHKKSNKGWISLLTDTFKEIATHRKFRQCSAQKSRGINHFLVFYGFILLLLTTAFAIIASITNNYPLSLFHPVKIMGNVAALMLIVGTSMMIIKRITDKKGKSNYHDWMLPVVLFLLTISGVLMEFARFGNWSSAYHLYFVHLVLVWFLIIYAPYTKFGHFIYRFTALIFSRRYERR